MKVTKRPYQVFTTHTDPLSRLTPQALAGFMQESALVNVKEIGVPHTALLEKRQAWVLLRIKIFFVKPVLHGSTITVSTWASGSDKYYFYRDFKVHDEHGILVAEATSNWILINLDKRQLLAVPPELSNLTFTEQGTASLPRVKSKLPLLSEATHEQQFRIGWHDLDIYHHANNSVYYKWLLEPLPLEWLSSKTLQTLDINIKNESKYGQMLIGQVALKGEGEVYHLLKTEDGAEVVRAVSTWK